MKKIILTLLFVIVASLGAVALSACGSCGGDSNGGGNSETHNHVFGEYTVTQEATCTEDGYETATCTLCDETDTRVIPAKGHSWGEPAKVAPTCLDEGYTQTQCSVCKTTQKSEIVPATGHKWNIPAATCTEGQVCEVCEKPGEPAHGHVYDEGVITTPVTCSADGYKTYSCIECHAPEAEKTEVYAKATGHVLGAATAEETVEGCRHTYTYTAICQSCQQPIQVGEPEVVELHNLVAKITKQATCAEDGTKTYTCEDCRQVIKTEVYKDENAHDWENPQTSGNIITYTCHNDHNHTRTVVKADSNTAEVTAEDLKSAGELELSNAAISFDEAAKGVLDGKGSVNVEAGTLEGDDREQALSGLQDKADRVTGEIYNFTMEADGSQVTDFGGKVTIKIPYTLEEGEDPENIVIWYINGETLEPMEATYTVIGGVGYAVFETEHFSYYTVTRMTPEERCALYGHNYVTKSANATCVTNGYIIKICTRCKDKAQDEIIPATGHNWQETTQPATCTVNGKLTRHCQNCSETLESTIFAAGHKWTLNEELSSAATCSASGKSHYDCSECDESYEITEAQKAHKWQITVIAPTCTLEGYTHKECVNCGTTVNTDVLAALGHDMVDTVIAPTCTEKGYTTHECSRCGYKTDNTDEQAALGHDMVNGVCSRCGTGCSHDWQQTATVDATCTEAGYTEMTCPKCGSVKKENVTAALGHNFGLKECSRCHAPNPALGEYYYNLLSSMYIKGLALKLTDLQISQRQETYVGDTLYEQESYDIMDEKQIGVTEMFISLDGGELFGAGRATMHVKSRVGAHEYEESDNTAIIILQDAKLYLSSEAEGASYGSEYIVYDLDAMFGEGFDYDKITSALEWMDGYGKNVLGDLAGAHKEEISAVLGNVLGLLFGEPEVTADGYKFTLDAATLKAINADLSELTVSEIVDKYLGEGTFAAIRENVEQLLNYNCLALYSSIVDNNIDYDELCAAIDAFMTGIMGAPEFDADAILQEYLADDGPLDAKVADMLAQVLAQYVPQTADAEGGEDQETPPTPGEELIAMVESYFKQAEELIVYEMLGEQGESIQAMVDGYIDMVGEMANISFTTDKNGNLDRALISMDIKDYEINRYSYDSKTIKSLISVKGNAELTFNGTIDVGFVKDGLDKIQRGVRIGKNVKATYSETRYGNSTTIELNSDGAGNITSVTRYSDYGRNTTGHGVESVGGVSRIYVDYEITMRVSTIVVYGGSVQISTGSKIICNGWRSYSISGKSTETMITRHVRTYFDAEGNVISEVKLQADEKGEAHDSRDYISFYYKEETNELRVNEPHEYVLDEDRSVAAQGCEGEGYRLYVCGLCNSERKEYYTNGHRHTYIKVELEDGSETCEDGVIVTEICRDCGKELYSYEDNYHIEGETYIDVKDYGSKCGGEIIVRACACGQNRYVDWGEIECDMHRVDGNDGTEGTYKCAVTDCPFEFTVSSKWVPAPHGTLCDQVLEITYKFGTNTGKPYTATDYDGWGTDHKGLTVNDYSDSEPTYGTEGALFTVTQKSGHMESCSVCGYQHGEERTEISYYTDAGHTLLVKRHTEMRSYSDSSEGTYITDETFDGTESGGILTYNETETHISHYNGDKEDRQETVTEITFLDDKAHGPDFGGARPVTYHRTNANYMDNVKRNSNELTVNYDTDGNTLRTDEDIFAFKRNYGWGYFYEGYLGNYEYTEQMFEIDGVTVSNTMTITIRYEYNYESHCYYDLHIARQNSDIYYDTYNFDKEHVENHISADSVIVSEATCTQDEVYTVTCGECGYQGDERLLGNNNRHSYVYDDLTGRFVCENCGLENDKDVDGIYILEDLTEKEGYAREGSYVIGYNYNRYYSGEYHGDWWDFDRFYRELFQNHYHPFGFTVEVSLYAEDREIPLNIDCKIVGLNGEEHTLIYVDIAQVAQLAEEQGVGEYGVMISFVFNDDSGLACNITLNPADYVQ